MKTKQLSEFIRTNGLYQSSKKVSGEIHAACFLYSSSWTYFRFLTNTTVQIFNLIFDLSKVNELNQKIKPIQKITNKYESYNIVEENWCDGTFTFKRQLPDNVELNLYGHIRNDLFGEQELLLVDANNYAECFQFVEFPDNFRLEYELLNYFKHNKYLSINGMPTFGYSSLENDFVF